MNATAPATRDALRLVVGVAAIVAPALHVLTDVMEWLQQGFSAVQLWLNYVAFVPMAWLLLGVYAAHEIRPRALGLAGAVLYGAAFTYYAHTTLFALAAHVPDYASLRARLGDVYTLHGILMIAGGLTFAWSALRAAWLPRLPVLLFIVGLAGNLILGVLPVPDILQTAGSAIRNLGLITMGLAVLSPSPSGEPA